MTPRKCKCKKCGAEIIFIPTLGGKSMPCNAAQIYYKSNPDGHDKIVTKNGCVFTGEVLESTPSSMAIADGIGYTPHWGSCPYAESFRKGGKK